ncbi:gamma-interferon-responsive lysosomal thiol protein-like [Brassica napus]|uniref:gamma-interferon-responsive lysosomal thiol protein-like n=1 Tax=Brassica napus TaxID=3708 RepID=UPI00207AA497|nr:gamma-interferon-responsive lysosomal thiol protein-like [Brassica napus]
MFWTQKKHYSFIRCVENDTTKWESCLKNSRSEKAINDCYHSDLPKTLILGYANMTLSLKPQHKYVPWVTLNSKPLNAQSPDDFVAQICKAYKGKAALPKLCKSSAFSKSLESKVLKLQVSYADEARN